jgi:ATP-dependent DNA helicase RecG
MNESETIELKKSLAELKEGLISISAILNKHGAGEIWFGVAPNGQAVGLQATDKTLRDLSQAVGAHIEPKIYPHISLQSLNGRDCIQVQFEGLDSPYFAYGRAYMRVADEDRQLSAAEIRKLTLEQHQQALRWDNQTLNLPIKALDSQKVKAFSQRAGLMWSSLGTHEAQRMHQALAKLEVLQDAQLLNAAKLFFGKDPIQMRCAVFASTTSATIIDRHDFDGDILSLIDEAQKYILKNIHIGMRLEGLYRVDVPEISLDALREAIINAFCHRDWRDPDYVQVAIYKDRIEIRNPGTLVGNLTIADIRQGNVSRRRNPLVAELFRRIHMVEAWGRGMPLILANAPTVSFRETAGLFIASFARPSYLLDTPSSGDTPESQLESQPESQPESMEVRLLQILKAGALSKAEMSQKLGQKSVSGPLNQLVRTLLRSGKVAYTLPDKPNSRLQKYKLNNGQDK